MTLGTLCKNGHIGLLENGKPNYELAKEYYLVSETSLAYYNLALLYYYNYIDSTEHGGNNYELAGNFFLKSGTCSACYHLGILCADGHICLSENKQIDYNLALLFLDHARLISTDSFERLISEVIKNIEDIISQEDTPNQLDSNGTPSTHSHPSNTDTEDALPAQVASESSDSNETVTPQRSDRRTILTKAEKAKKKLAKALEKLKERQRNSHPTEQSETRDELKVVFRSDCVKQEFLSKKGKINELMQDIQDSPFSEHGSGRPEILRGEKVLYNGKLYAVHSRRLNHHDRFTYAILEGRRILVISVSGHYDYRH